MIDAEALMAEYDRQVADLAHRLAVAVGEKVALQKKNAELQKQLDAQQPMIGG